MIKALLLSAALTTVVTTAAAQQSNCASYDVVISVLEADYGEEPLFAGMSLPNTDLIQLFINPDTGTWTAIATDLVTGMTCVVSSGDSGNILPLGNPT